MLAVGLTAKLSDRSYKIFYFNSSGKEATIDKTRRNLLWLWL